MASSSVPEHLARLDANGIARHLIDGIASGHLPVGSLLPTEFELCEHYKASRYAIRAALNELQQMGLVSRRKNVGTRVESAQPKESFRPSLASVDDLVQFGERHVRAVQSIREEVVSGSLAEELGCAPQSRWLRISSVRSEAGQLAKAIGWTDVYIDPAYSDVGEMARACPGTLVSSLLATHHGRHIAQIEQEIRAVNLQDGQVCEALNVDRGCAALRIIRRYYDVAGELFEASVTVHPADRFAVTMRLERSRA